MSPQDSTHGTPSARSETQQDDDRSIGLPDDSYDDDDASLSFEEQACMGKVVKPHPSSSPGALSKKDNTIASSSQEKNERNKRVSFAIVGELSRSLASLNFEASMNFDDLEEESQLRSRDGSKSSLAGGDDSLNNRGFSRLGGVLPFINALESNKEELGEEGFLIGIE
mmetsp:Transcript_7817/g.16103  ORF Transcript_7817/g.16103 Transcript_7817/m.16103 type:complete len:168 (+) Transcript_7817:134-637(+)|eukprot:CAMPEP_0201119082 /NCGR_PEP_ID=MMETSP0850-20130426/3282_1 /ASSEMBLY_ACC=CAM_ASM_000622 /TAXON_ID=183588 /ORGANISM="Pseudo-nitzschia fraudulenta, Strain WWA7" /LENGTH=167 /DNA_ID=CAMNT_0047384663 /DNA_START=153 /DNA_END=656 /DNA_ORIENTATION=-